jgi:hypothetical protein
LFVLESQEKFKIWRTWQPLHDLLAFPVLQFFNSGAGGGGGRIRTLDQGILKDVLQLFTAVIYE